tara:strand:+ start:18231 stop:18545 length:315 start_codon:yes stop_codon:yes gene_type:complete
MNIIIWLVISVLLNLSLIWYIIQLLKKFYFISENLADLFLTTKAFRVFANSMYSMESFHGEPIIKELIEKIRDVNHEIELFRDIFEYSIDKEMEEELDTAEEEA